MRTTSASEEALHATGRQSYSYFLTSKSRFATPTLTHQFRVRWPWPNNANRPSGAAREGDKQRSHEKATGQRRDSTDNSSGASPIFEVGTRRYRGSTTVLSMSSDPHAPRAINVGDGDGEVEEGVLPHFDRHHCRRVALLLSDGQQRFCVPLLPAAATAAAAVAVAVDPSDAPATALDTRGQPIAKQYWRLARKTSAATPTCTEVVVGELASIEWVMESWHRHLRRFGKSGPYSGNRESPHNASPFSTRIDLSAAAASPDDDEGGHAGADRVLPFWTRPTPPPSALPVHSFLMHSVPFKVIWLDAVAERLLVSLPCEERIVTLTVPYPQVCAGRGGGGGVGGVPGYIAGQAEPVPLRPSHSFSLPRGIVPLDVVEVPQRPFIAVGTYEHGVLLCWLDVVTGAVTGVAQAVALSGVGSAIFPVTRLAAVFPPLFPFWQNADWPRRSASLAAGDDAAGTHALPWAAKSRFLASLGDGALVCCSPYDMQSVVVKNLGASAGTSVVWENFCPGKPHDPLLSVAPCTDRDVGVLAVTTQGLLTRLQVFCEDDDDDDDTAAGGEGSSTAVPRKRTRGEAATHSTRSASRGTSEEREEGRGGDEETSAFSDRAELPSGGQQSSVPRDLALELVARHSKGGHSLLSERVAPVVLRTSAVARPVHLHRLGETAPVYQLKPSKQNRLDGPMVQHFLVATTYANEVVLLDRVLTVHKLLSAYKLTPCALLPALPCRQDGDGMGQKEQTAVKREESDPDEDAPQPATSPAVVASPKDRMEDLCVGAVILSAGHQWLTVAAAHHGDTISVLTYAGPARELGVEKRSYHTDKR